MLVEKARPSVKASVERRTQEDPGACWSIQLMDELQSVREPVKRRQWAAHLGSTHTKIRMVRRRLAWPPPKDDRQVHEAFHRVEYIHHEISANKIKVKVIRTLGLGKRLCESSAHHTSKRARVK